MYNYLKVLVQLTKCRNR